MVWTSNKKRISTIKESPFSWKEKDLLTAAEKYMEGIIELPLVEFTLPCFPGLEDGITNKIAQIWMYTSASFHLQKTTKKEDNHFSSPLQLKAARIYEQEAQRILGSIFPIENKFWNTFYSRQESEEKKPLIAIDALHFGTNCREQIPYQLLLQSLKAIINGHYAPSCFQKSHFENAKRLIIDLPIRPFQSWLNLQIV